MLRGAGTLDTRIRPDGLNLASSCRSGVRLRGYTTPSPLPLRPGPTPPGPRPRRSPGTGSGAPTTRSAAAAAGNLLLYGPARRRLAEQGHPVLEVRGGGGGDELEHRRVPLAARDREQARPGGAAPFSISSRSVSSPTARTRSTSSPSTAGGRPTSRGTRRASVRRRRSTRPAGAGGAAPSAPGTGQRDHGVLQPEPEGEHVGGALVGLVAHVPAGVGGVGCHRWCGRRLPRAGAPRFATPWYHPTVSALRPTSPATRAAGRSGRLTSIGR